jgi:predicted RNase H-like HicB family nuclease
MTKNRTARWFSGAKTSSISSSVVELPGCIAHGESREATVKNGLIAIENWLETAEELKRDIPTPVDVTAFEKMTAQQAQDVRNLFEQAVKKAVNEALMQLEPEMAKHLQNALALRQQSGLVSHIVADQDCGMVRPRLKT